MWPFVLGGVQRFANHRPLKSENARYPTSLMPAVHAPTTCPWSLSTAGPISLSDAGPANYQRNRSGINSMTNSLAAFVKQRRKQLQLSQPDLAAKVGVGLRFTREPE